MKDLRSHMNSNSREQRKIKNFYKVNKEVTRKNDRREVEKELRGILRDAKAYDWNKIDMIYKIENALKRLKEEK